MIKFKHLKKIQYDDIYFIKYINDFDGVNIFHKFKNILKQWENDVSYDLNFIIDNKNVKITLAYLISELEEYNNEPIIIKNDIIEIVADVATNFKENNGIFSVEDYIKKLRYLSFDLDFDKLTEDEKSQILGQLPPSTYSFIVNQLSKNNNKIIEFSNPILKNFQLDFLSNKPYEIIHSLFKSFTDDYFRNVIYSLSKRIDGQILMNSTPNDIDFYIEKMNNEASEEKLPNLG